MPYNRTYSAADVARLLEASELNGGHSMKRHTNDGEDVWNGRRKKRDVPEKDSIFMIPRHALVPIVQELLNSADGQTALERLNTKAGNEPVQITSVILREDPGFDIFTIYRPPKRKNSPVPVQTYFDWLSTTKGDGFRVQVVMYVSRATYGTGEDIHIHTTFPKKYARTRGDKIVGGRR